MTSFAMSEYEVYKMYLALKLHFTTDNYDVIKQKGRVKASKAAFAKRKDLFSIRKVAKTYSDEEIANFLVANFTSGDRWGGMFDSEASNRYMFWKKKIESLSYTFEKDLDVIYLFLEENKLQIEELFSISKNEHPYIIKMFLRNSISLETLVILEKIEPFVSKFDEEISDTFLWPDLSRLIKKYKPFLTIDKEKYARIFREKFRYQ
jgi:hypothetical protein